MITVILDGIQSKCNVGKQFLAAAAKIFVILVNNHWSILGMLKTLLNIVEARFVLYNDVEMDQ